VNAGDGDEDTGSKKDADMKDAAGLPDALMMRDASS
jgi:hypothetical protein